jgi:hypothetical protein
LRKLRLSFEVPAVPPFGVKVAVNETATFPLRFSFLRFLPVVLTVSRTSPGALTVAGQETLSPVPV